MFDLQAERHGTAAILRLKGDVLLGDAVEFNRQMQAHMSSPQIMQTVLDLSTAGKMDKSGLGVLVSLSTRYQSRGRRLVLLNPAPHVAQLLKEAEIEGFFPTFDSEEELKGTLPSVAE